MHYTCICQSFCSLVHASATYHRSQVCSHARIRFRVKLRVRLRLRLRGYVVQRQSVIRVSDLAYIRPALGLAIPAPGADGWVESSPPPGSVERDRAAKDVLKRGAPLVELGDAYR